MAEELSGVTVIFIIAGGVLTFILLFIFAKRQIMRFALKSRRGPHVPIGHGAKKSLKKEIHRRIDLVPRIVYEPKLILENGSIYILPPGSKLQPYYYRLKACDDVKLLEQEILKQDKSLIRHPKDNLRSYLLNTLATPLIGQRFIQQFCDLYEHARYDPGDFSDEEYQVYSRLLLKLMDAARLVKSYPGGKKTSPKESPVNSKPLVKPKELFDPKILDKEPDQDILTENTETSV